MHNVRIPAIAMAQRSKEFSKSYKSVATSDNCIAFDTKQMTKTCTKQRRPDLHFATDMACDAHVRCCLENTLRWQPDFAAQKCKLEEACDSMGVEFLMMMICHPECNPIEGTSANPIYNSIY